MRLYRYFARKFVMTFLMVFVIFAVILAMIDLMEEVGRYGGSGVGFRKILQLILLSAPRELYEFLPLVMILSSLALFVGLARSSELVVTRALGWSAMRVLVAPISVALLIGVTAVTVLNPIVTGSSNLYEILSSRYRSGDEAAFSISANGLWLRQGTSGGQAVIQAASANADGSEFYDVTFIMFDATGTPSERIEARVAKLVAGFWQLSEAKDWSITDTENPEAASQRYDVMRIPTSLTQERIAAYLGTPTSISFWDMPAHIAQLKRAGFSTRRPLIWLQTELARPLFLATMVLIGAAFTMRHARSGHTGLMVLFAILSGFLLYFVRNFALILGENGQLPVLIAAWAPPAAGLLLAFGLILHLEDG
ncbi:LPS export ABC transporter permease LptG [Roseovarius arcticus]|uniref:LPS export ABC transporter permease LptG n=1 Tax=Roseovarius arcticus TaxID=2547404 RepID=UPI001110CD94|nr:LPS export ABC transporter permease LptG [Roseovarius arcticus]